MCIRDRFAAAGDPVAKAVEGQGNVAAPMPVVATGAAPDAIGFPLMTCLLYTSDAADERSSVDLGGRRIIKKKKKRR